MEIPEQTVEDFCRIVDHNNNGVISYAEWMSELADIDIDVNYDLLGDDKIRAVSALTRPPPVIDHPLKDHPIEMY